jgi:hypothetical protein
MNEVFAMAIVFFAIYQILKSFTDFLLKRKLINTGHVEKAEILSQPDKSNEINAYPTLKWGLVALFTGAGFIFIELWSTNSGIRFHDFNDSFLPMGILLVFISAGFLTYFAITSIMKPKF